MTDTGPREPQPIGVEQRPAPAVEAPQLPSPPADQNADLVDMLWAAFPDCLPRILRHSIDYGSDLSLSMGDLQRLLAWANARRDAAVGAAKVWRPIETAPQDGSWILGWAQSDRSPYGISWGRNHNGTLSWCTQFGSFVRGYITHWMPLPGMPVPDPLSTITAALSDTEARDA